MTTELQAFDQLKADIQLFVKPVFEVAVSSQETMTHALDAAKDLKGFEKKVEQRRKELVGPLNDRVKLINDYAKKVLEPLNTATAHLKTELRKWEMHMEKVRQEELRKAEEERKRLEAEAAEKARIAKKEAEAIAAFGSEEDAERARLMAAAEIESQQAQIIQMEKKAVKKAEEMKVTGSKKVWTFEISDEAQIPREFLKVDEKKIREAIRAGVREIPGVKIFQDIQIAVR